MNCKSQHPLKPIRTLVATAVLVALLGACSEPSETQHPIPGPVKLDKLGANLSRDQIPLSELQHVPVAREESEAAPEVVRTETVKAEAIRAEAVEAEAVMVEQSKASSVAERRLMLQSTGVASVVMSPSVVAPASSIMPAPMPEPVLQQQENRERYASIETSNVKRVADEPVSTFSIDVDTGSYSNIRRHLEQGQLPPSNAVRVEEMINYFSYGYEQPDESDVPFSVATMMAPTPWNASSELLRIAVKGVDVDDSDERSANLVFLVDVSGSMNSPDKLGLLKSSLSMLARGLDANDRVSIVTYAGAVGTVLDGAAGNDVAAIDDALSRLSAGGSTAGGAGIEAAYRLAKEHASDTTVNRVILATDGDFNVGLSDTESLIELIEKRREQGTALTTLGFGTGNYNDELMEQLADAGNGNHAYIDTLGEARKVLSQQLDGTLFTIAKDVKIQVEFNPAVVSEYRLIGYENRALADEDFANDKVDAGDIGAGHTVTALYEIVRIGEKGWLSERRYASASDNKDRNNELGELRLRYKKPGGTTSQLLVEAIGSNATLPAIEEADENFRFATAVAAFGEQLRDDRYLGDFDYQDVLALARGARGNDNFGYRNGFIELVELARVLDDRSTAMRINGHKTPSGGDDSQG